ncbi:hypothetical protein THAOC_19069, partial [Thalassiosira oceanica]
GLGQQSLLRRDCLDGVEREQIVEREAAALVELRPHPLVPAEVGVGEEEAEALDERREGGVVCGRHAKEQSSVNKRPPIERGSAGIFGVCPGCSNPRSQDAGLWGRTVAVGPRSRVRRSKGVSLDTS